MTKKNSPVLGNRLLLSLIIGLTMIYWLIVGFRIQIFRIIPGYFWHSMRYIDKDLAGFWLIVPAIIIAGAVVIYIVRLSHFDIRHVMVLVLLGYVLQLTFGFMEGRGVDGLRDRTVITGHAEFARLAAQDYTVVSVATHYEDFLKTSDSLKYVNTKPPGQLLFYMLVQKASNIISPVASAAAKFERLTTFAAFTFPLVTYLVLFPLFYLGRLLTSEKIAILSCIFYLFIPNVTLVTLHLDQTLYPVLAMTSLLCPAFACRRSWAANSIIGGICLYVALYISFSLLPVVLLVVMIIFILCMVPNYGKGSLLLSAKIAAGMLVGLALMYVVGRILLSYDPFIRYHNAMLYHQAWKLWTPGFGNVVLFAALNIIEIACWIGLPIALLYGANLTTSIRDAGRKVFTIPVLLSISLGLVVALTALFGKTKGEVARIWIFFVPCLCLLVSYELSRRFKAKSYNYMLATVIILQLATTLIMKRFQDFW